MLGGFGVPLLGDGGVGLGVDFGGVERVRHLVDGLLLGFVGDFNLILWDGAFD